MHLVKNLLTTNEALGFKICEPYCHRLWEMDKHFSEYLPEDKELSITKDMVEAYVALRENESVKTQHLRMSTVRQFVLFMNRIGYDFYVYPETAFVQIKDYIECFLKWLEKENDYSAASLNQRLAAIHSFCRFVILEAPEYMGMCTSILSIKMKKTFG